MEIVVGLAMLVAFAVVVWWVLARTGPAEDEELAGLVTANWQRIQDELEDGTLDPDELADDPLVWDEGADDEG